VSGFTPGEVRAIAEAAALGPETGLDRLTELLRASATRLAEAAALADQLRAGEAVDIGGGEYLARDAPGGGGRVLGRVERP
jgi:hypothetical protein